MPIQRSRSLSPAFGISAKDFIFTHTYIYHPLVNALSPAIASFLFMTCDGRLLPTGKVLHSCYFRVGPA